MEETQPLSLGGGEEGDIFRDDDLFDLSAMQEFEATDFPERMSGEQLAAEIEAEQRRDLARETEEKLVENLSEIEGRRGEEEGEEGEGEELIDLPPGDIPLSGSDIVLSPEPQEDEEEQEQEERRTESTVDFPIIPEEEDEELDLDIGGRGKEEEEEEEEERTVASEPPFIARWEELQQRQEGELRPFSVSESRRSEALLSRESVDALKERVREVEEREKSAHLKSQSLLRVTRQEKDPEEQMKKLEDAKELIRTLENESLQKTIAFEKIQRILEREVEQNTQVVETLESQIDQQHATIQNLLQENVTLKARSSQVVQDTEDVIDELEHLRFVNKELQSSNQTLSRELDDIKMHSISASSEVMEARNDIKRLSEENRRLRENLRNVQQQGVDIPPSSFISSSRINVNDYLTGKLTANRENVGDMLAGLSLEDQVLLSQDSWISNHDNESIPAPYQVY